MLEAAVTQSIRLGEDRYVVTEEELNYIMTSYRSKIQSVCDWDNNAQILENVLRSDTYDTWSQTEIDNLVSEMRNSGTLTVTMEIF